MIKEKISIDFTSILRAILRQDPDVILIGEIRDLETIQQWSPLKDYSI